MVLSSCKGTVGVVSNAAHQNEKIAKAGRSRWLGRRPSVRGVAMNPVDHPLGGGAAKSSGEDLPSHLGELPKDARRVPSDVPTVSL